MQAADGALDSPNESPTTGIDVSGWTPGVYTLSVRARDAAGTWGPTGAVVLTVEAQTSDSVFADGFETGDFSAWTSIGGARRISVTPEAALSGGFGMKAVINGQTPSFVMDDTPGSEASYHARFYFHPNGTATHGRAHNILVGRNAAGAAIFRVRYRRTSGGLYQIRAAVLRSGVSAFTKWQSVTNAAHALEIAWQSATNAAFALYVDGELKQTLSGVDTSAYRLESVRLGPSGGLGPSTSGTEYYDAFVSTRDTYIGP